ncbi:7263_t:CDS:1, partial [Gigaspora rosea]
TFPIQFGTPPQILNVSVDTVSNILWVVSEFCMNPFGNACSNRTTNFFNTSFSNTTTSDYEEFTIKYVNESEIVAIWANDIIIINNEVFGQMTFGLPKDIIGNENISIPDTITGQI